VLGLNSSYAEPYCGRGNVFRDLKRYDEAIAAYDKALTIRPDLEHAWLGRGNVFYDLEAIAAYDRALSVRADLEQAWLGRGDILFEFKRYDEAFAAYDKALVLKPELVGAEGARLSASGKTRCRPIPPYLCRAHGAARSLGASPFGRFVS
jgi:tetratricopeptide (TPR) repeat protein